MKKSPGSFRTKAEYHLEATASFQAAWWCRSGHAQTIWSPLFRHFPRIRPRRERLELPDGDFIDLDWGTGSSGSIVVILHGLEGSSRSPYARGMFAAVQRLGMRPVIMHFRGCSGVENRLARSYHCGDTGDLAFLVQTLKHREPDTALAAIGYSLGGNVLLKWLGETGSETGLDAAAAVSVPYLLKDSAQRLDQGLSRLYQRYLLVCLKRSLRRKFRGRTPPFSAALAAAARNFWEFDDAVTAPLHGFSGAEHYYSHSSSRQYLNRIRIPTLLVHSADDPFMPATVLPTPGELAPGVILELQTYGGHVGFIEGRWPWRPHFWLEDRIPRFLAAQLKGRASRTSPVTDRNP